MRFWVAALCAVAAPGLAAAGDVEIAARAGQVVPFYEQSFRFDPGSLVLSSLPGVSVDPVQDLLLDGHGGLALSGGISWYPAGSLGLEGRVDTADVDVRTRDAIVHLRVDLFPLLPPISADLDIPARADVERLKPVSLNLKARTRGRLKAHASAGVSYLPSLRFSAHAALQTTSPSLLGFPLPLARLALRAEASPNGEGESRFGFNAGAGASWPLVGRLSAEVEGRYFRFDRQTLVWSGEPGIALNPAEQQLLQDTLSRLAPVRFNPTFFQLTGGLKVRF